MTKPLPSIEEDEETEVEPRRGNLAMTRQLRSSARLIMERRAESLPCNT